MIDIIVKKSKIEGLGVFASHNFKKGEIVLNWNTAQKLTKEELIKLPKKEKAYIMYINGKYILPQYPERYVNHSCDANTYIDNSCNVAKKDIKKDEEITEDYVEDGEPGFKMKCNCRNKDCRGIIKRIS